MMRQLLRRFGPAGACAAIAAPTLGAQPPAAATVIGVRIIICDGWVTLRVADNGCGFDTRAVRVGSFGLLSMHERAALIGARLEIESAPGDGTTIAVSSPVNGVRHTSAPAGVAE